MCIYVLYRFDRSIGWLSRRGLLTSRIGVSSFFKPFIFPSPFGESSDTPNKQGCSDVLAGYIWHSDSNVDDHTSVTPGPPTCRVVTSSFQRHPSPATIATSPSPLDLIVVLTEVVYIQRWNTLFRMPIYPMLNQWNANPMTPNPGLWLVESVVNIDENLFRMPIYPYTTDWVPAHEGLRWHVLAQIHSTHLILTSMTRGSG